MEFDFLKPLDNEILQVISEFSSQQLGSKIVLNTAEDFPDLTKIKIAIIGVLDNRGGLNQTEKVNLDPIRKELYGLFPGNWDASIADLGNIDPTPAFLKESKLLLLEDSAIFWIIRLNCCSSIMSFIVINTKIK